MKVEVIYNKDNDRQIRLLTGKLNKASGDRLGRVLMTSAINISEGAKESIQTGTRSGRVYRKASGRLHRASAPGEVPASDTGQLANSIHVAKQGRLSVRVGSVVNHGRYMEEGTNSISPRPWLLPQIDKELPELERNVTALFGEI